MSDSSYGVPVKRDPTPEGPCPRAAIEVTVDTVTSQRHWCRVVPAFGDVERELEDILDIYEAPFHFPHPLAEEATLKVVWFSDDQAEIGELARYRAWHNAYHFF